MKRLLNYSAEQLREVFSRWNEGELSSYLIEITAAIFASKDEETGQPLVNLILDCAEQKGTGAWTAQTALEFGAAVPTLVEAVFARYLSSIKEERLRAEQLLSGPAIQPALPELVKAIKDALYAAKICSYAQGFALMRIVSEEFGWKLNLGQIVQIWRAGCIIRAEFLDHVKEAFDKEPDLPNLLLNPFFKSVVAERQAAWRRVVATAVRNGIPVPAFSSALAYYDSYRTGSLPANLLQAQRDYFGAHTFERVDKLGRFHAKWY